MMILKGDIGAQHPGSCLRVNAFIDAAADFGIQTVITSYSEQVIGTDIKANFFKGGFLCDFLWQRIAELKRLDPEISTAL